MKLLLVGVFGLLWCNTAFAQDLNNYIQVDANTNLNFILDDAADLESTQTIPNAISIKLRSRQDHCNVSAQITSFTYPFSFVPTAGLLALQWTSDNSNKDYSLITGPILLSTMSQLLFVQKKHPHIFTFNYNLLLYPTGYNMVPGSYNFTILFTMTQQ